MPGAEELGDGVGLRPQLGEPLLVVGPRVLGAGQHLPFPGLFPHRLGSGLCLLGAGGGHDPVLLGDGVAPLGGLRPGPFGAGFELPGRLVELLVALDNLRLRCGHGRHEAGHVVELAQVTDLEQDVHRAHVQAVAHEAGHGLALQRVPGVVELGLGPLEVCLGPAVPAHGSGEGLLGGGQLGGGSGDAALEVGHGGVEPAPDPPRDLELGQDVGLLGGRLVELLTEALELRGDLLLALVRRGRVLGCHG